MEQDEARALIQSAIGQRGTVWADLGAGTGTFTRALASLLGPDGVVIAVDRDARALRALEREAASAAGDAQIRTVVGDFTQPVDLPRLDGVLLANALHFVPYDDQVRVLRDIARHVTSGGTVAIVEYERQQANPYVPYPIRFDALVVLAERAGLGPPRLLATRPSRYQGSIYAASLGVQHEAVTAARPDA